MFNKSKIEAGLYGIVGLRQPYNPNYQIIDTDNLSSDSGYYVTDHPMVKVEYIKETQDFDGISDTDFNTYLKQLQQSAISSVANAVFNEVEYVDRQVLYPYTHNRVNVDTLPSCFIGHKIEVSCEKNVAFEITRCMFDFQGAGDIELLLFNTSTPNPIKSKVITVSTSHHVEELNWRVDNSGDTYKGEYYLGYLSNYADIGTLKPFKRDYESSNVTANITYLDIDKVYFDGHSTNILPDLTKEDATDLTTGLNPDITVFEDYTDLILNNKMLFGYPVYLDMCIKIISSYTSSNRSNRNQRFAEAQVVRMLQEIEGQNAVGTVKITGLRPMLLGELKRLEKQIQQLKQGYFGGEITVQTLM